MVLAIASLSYARPKQLDEVSSQNKEQCKVNVCTHLRSVWEILKMRVVVVAESHRQYCCLIMRKQEDRYRLTTTDKKDC